MGNEFVAKKGLTSLGNANISGSLTALILSGSLTGSSFGTASWAINVVNSSGAGTTLFTGSTYPITASWAVSSSWAPSFPSSIAISASWATSSYTASALNQSNFGTSNILFVTWSREASSSISNTNVTTASKIFTNIIADTDDVYAQDWQQIIIGNISSSFGFTIYLRPTYGTYSGSVKTSWLIANI